MARSNSFFGEPPRPQISVDISPYSGDVLTQGTLYHPHFPDVQIALTLQRDPSGGDVSIQVKYEMSERQFRSIFTSHPSTASSEGFVRELLDRLVHDNQGQQVQAIIHMLKPHRRKGEPPEQTLFRLLDAVNVVESGLEAYRTGGVPI